MDEKIEEIFGDEVESRTSLEVYDEMVTNMAGSIYTELEKLVGAYGQEAVTGLMPLLVSVLESLATTCARAREKEDQLEMVREDKQRLLIQYERERDGRKRAEERCMEMEDGIEQERKLFKINLLNMEGQTKNMETKARSYADQMIVKNYKELRYQRALSSEAVRLSGHNAALQGLEKKIPLLDFQEAPPSLESIPDVGSDLASEKPPQPEVPSVVDDIINSTPELKLDSEPFEASTPKGNSDLGEEARDRNNDSLFAEMYGTSPEFIADVDEGADLQVDTARKSLIARVEELTAERETLKSEVETVMQNLSRCEFKLRESDQELQMTRIELDEARKLCREDAEVDIPAAQRKRFTRAEMARVLMERNQYKEKLMELQDAIRRTEMLRISKDVQDVQMKKSSFWKLFDRLFSPSTAPQGKPVTPPKTPSPVLNRTQSDAAIMYSAAGNSVVRNQPVNFYTSHTSDDVDAVSLRSKKHEHYRHIRSHIWKEHGRAQIHGWSVPPAFKSRGDSHAESESRNAPVLVQLRLLDQKDPRTKLWCATGAATDSTDKRNEDGTNLNSLAWICSGTHSVSEIMVIDATSSNHVVDQFEIHNVHVLCVAYVPAHKLNGAEEQEACKDINRDSTIWFGTQEGRLEATPAIY
ncbi:hypothetical protein GDO78_021007 [Eleutherodactylus coqui]|uniref:RH1 domain-containing protein n=1 Tax=Eleutherodactylus coqui TaxID=57060 RepID=A0A8J6EHQ0_ELECQ|nr:hypothetical protein GDO78_021007 [Eleutherodactylus coqui]